LITLNPLRHNEAIKAALQRESFDTVLTIIRIRVHNKHMIICVCKAVSDRAIRTAVKAGANSLRDLTRDLGVGTCCGKCLPEAKSSLAASLKSCDSARPNLFSPPATEFAV
jgi:bacterioferritin-associated ferredoxin